MVPTETFAAAIYAATLSGLFGVSALYHRGRWRPVARRVLQRADQLMILLLIAGSATPAFLLAVTGRAGVIGLSVLWALALTAAACRVVWLNAPPRLVGAVYLGLGWIAGLALPAVWMRFGVVPVVLLTTGGVLYTVGALVYYRRPSRPDPGRVWVSRGLPRLRLRGRHLPIPRDRTIHRLIAARHGTARLGWLKVGTAVAAPPPERSAANPRFASLAVSLRHARLPGALACVDDHAPTGPCPDRLQQRASDESARPQATRPASVACSPGPRRRGLR